MTKAARLRAGRTEDACPRAHAENACPPAHAEDACPRRTRTRTGGRWTKTVLHVDARTPGSRLSARAVLSVAHGIKDAGEGRCRPDKREDRRLPQEMQDLRPSARSFSRPPGPKTAIGGAGRRRICARARIALHPSRRSEKDCAERHRSTRTQERGKALPAGRKARAGALFKNGSPARTPALPEAKGS